MVFEQFIRYAGLAVGLMVFEKFIRSAGLAVGLKPSARGCEARLRGLCRIMYSKTISPRLRDAKPACAGYAGLFLQRPSPNGYLSALTQLSTCVLPNPPPPEEGTARLPPLGGGWEGGIP